MPAGSLHTAPACQKVYYMLCIAPVSAGYLHTAPVSAGLLYTSSVCRQVYYIQLKYVVILNNKIDYSFGQHYEHF